jgi:hypothetical protein
MQKTSVWGDTESVVWKITPSLEVVAHDSLQGKRTIFKHPAADVCLHVVLPEYLHNHAANLTSGFAAILEGAHENCSGAKVIPCDLIIFFNFSTLWNHSIVALGNGVNAELNKVNVLRSILQVTQSFN